MEKALLGEELIDLSRLTRDEITKIDRKERYVCVTCQKEVAFKNGTRKRAHFAHLKEGERQWQPESAAHRLVKESLARWLRELCIPVDVERRFVEIDRIADVYFEFQGRKYVFEVQKSPMSDLEFQKRIDDYAEIGITVVWIFLGVVTKKKKCYRLPAVMHGRTLDTFIHFCTKTVRLTVFGHPVFLSTSAIYCQAISKRLVDVKLENLLSPAKKRVWMDESWVEVKEQFRRKGWARSSRSEMKLVEQCLLRGFNLAMAPPVVGWPVPGAALRKPLFIWQMYVVMVLLKHFRVGDVFKTQDVVRFLVGEYGMFEQKGVAWQVEAYLKWLVRFNVLVRRSDGFEYRKEPETFKAMESCLAGDRILYEEIVNGSK